MTRYRRAALVALPLLLLAGCAAGPNDVVATSGSQPAGFWLGLWQGLISPVTFLVSLFNDHVNIYEVHNNGNWYNFGFMLGISTVFSALARPAAVATGRRRERRRNHRPDR
ncbi:hypothetical protein [Actinocatenispora rupis]|uniref:Lipoprotein n=1 Tax=Actinocatenispora rupis TaxID=519421 RepID=A0A8J3NDZ2_9ACTN|nr:hypothetical protein [Actinocatenispora rupis]GID15516.1 hypothetical protein Aru02nite_64050 [Actinocatenispora rupis]